MTINDLIILVKKIAVGIVLILIPLFIFLAGLWIVKIIL